MEQVKKKGFLERLLGSRVKTSSVTLKEKILGHLVGPLGLILVVNTITNISFINTSLHEKVLQCRSIFSSNFCNLMILMEPDSYRQA